MCNHSIVISIIAGDHIIILMLTSSLPHSMSHYIQILQLIENYIPVMVKEWQSIELVNSSQVYLSWSFIFIRNTDIFIYHRFLPNGRNCIPDCTSHFLLSMVCCYHSELLTNGMTSSKQRRVTCAIFHFSSFKLINFL
jgi:hypothetical protein